ncbi:Crp/Fnr family transcriptional regulator [Desulfovibrio legallii]|uniref:cAMP-binding domain of CRP or a regulatory subunit of cAMP-dependent protein kinases n=1 Tax=Desulfovibrio legallii TaxID=571438 RepID=A0A1G7PZS6_9BACT|nr:Crp/Fnr family transcriptional regulator [Desulfovibrio legallii]SDF91728.1 cAMP-binding domain of CRP or a regulatory subunit of cAMP-dependent protein kinases [Desulfovibrio legallii]
MEQALRICPLFGGMTPEEARRCLACSGAAITAHAKGSLIFGETDPPARLYVLLEGAVSVCRESAQGRRAVMAHIDQPGDLFGEVYVFLGQASYGCSVLAESPARVLGIPGRFFYATCEKGCTVHARMIRNMLGIFAHKALSLTRRVALLSSGSLRRKLAGLLLERRRPDGSPIPGMNREQMAEFLGVTRPSLSRELAAMRDEGLLELHGRHIRLPDPAALRRLCEYPE